MVFSHLFLVLTSMNFYLSLLFMILCPSLASFCWLSLTSLASNVLLISVSTSTLSILLVMIKVMVQVISMVQEQKEWSMILQVDVMEEWVVLVQKVEIKVFSLVIIWFRIRWMLWELRNIFWQHVQQLCWFLYQWFFFLDFSYFI